MTSSSLRLLPRLLNVRSRALPALLSLVLVLIWVPADPALAQDNARPEITSGPTVTSSPASGDTYRAGEAITVALTFSEAVTVTGTPRLRLTIGDNKRWAKYAHTAEDGATLSFSYVVKDNDADADGVSVAKNRLRLNGGTIADADGNAARLKHPALPDQAAHKVNGTPDEPTPPANSPPQFASDTATRSVDENSAAGTNVGDPVTATDADGDTLTYSLAVSDPFTIDAGSGQIRVQGDLDHETQSQYLLIVNATDPDGASGSVAVTVSVLNVNEPGVVSFIPAPPQAGSGFTAAIVDPDGVVDGSVAWQWKRSPDGTTAANVDRTDFPNIPGATGNILLLTQADEGRWLRALAIYEDAFGPGQRARSQTANPVAPDPEQSTPDPELHTSGNVGNTHDGKSYAELRCDHWLGGTWRDDTNSCSRPGKVVWRSVVKARYFTGTVIVGNIKVWQNQSAPATVTGGGPSYGTRQWRTGTFGSLSASVLTRITLEGVTGSRYMVPGTWTAEYTWHACDRGDNHGEENCREFERDLAFKYVAPDQIPSWDTRAKDAYATWKSNRNATNKVEPQDDQGAAASMNQPGFLQQPPEQEQSQQQQSSGQQQQQANAAPQFATNSAARSVDENSPAGTSVGDPVTATDGDTLTYELNGSDTFVIDGSGRITVASDAALDHESQASHEITVTATDPDGATASIAVTIFVLNVNEPGVVSFIPDQPQAGSGFTATIIDPDGVVEGSVKWQWKRSPDGTTAANVDTTDFPNIEGATGNILVLTDADEGRWLRALAIYEDPFGPGQRARSQTANPVLPAPQQYQEPQEQNSLTVTVTDESTVQVMDGRANNNLTGLNSTQDAKWEVDSASSSAGFGFYYHPAGTDGRPLRNDEDAANVVLSYDGTAWPTGTATRTVTVTATRGNNSYSVNITVNKVEAKVIATSGQSCSGMGENRRCSYVKIENPTASAIEHLRDNRLIRMYSETEYAETGEEEGDDRVFLPKWSIDRASRDAGFGLTTVSTDPQPYNPNSRYQQLALSYDGTEWPADTTTRTVTVTVRLGRSTASLGITVNKVDEGLKVVAVTRGSSGYERTEPSTSIRSGDGFPRIILLRSNRDSKWSIDDASAAAGFGLKRLDQTDYTSYAPGTEFATEGWDLQQVIALSYDGTASNGHTVTVTASARHPITTARILQDSLEITVTVDPGTVYPSLRGGGSGSRSYPQLRCENWLGGTWRDDTNSCSRPGMVVFDREITAQVYMEGRSGPTKIVTVTGGGPADGGRVSYRENGRDRTGIMVPGTKRTTYTWEACDSRGEDCREFTRNLAFKYVAPDQIPSWDKAAQCAYNRWISRGNSTVPEPKHVGTSVTEPLPGCTLP